MANLAVVSSLLLLLVAAASPLSNAAPVCPLTGVAATKTEVPIFRCLAAASTSCCMPCGDYEFGPRFFTSNASKAIESFAPGMWNTTGVFAQGLPKTCDIFAGFQQCELLLESIACASWCNPDSGNYVAKEKDGPTITICQPFADTLWAACNGTKYGTIAGVTNSTYFGSYGVAAIGNILYGVTAFNATVIPGTTGCFNGPTPAQLPKTTLCCDPLELDIMQCPIGSVSDKYIPMLNRGTNTTQCMNDTSAPKSFYTLPPTPPVPKAAAKSAAAALVGVVSAAVSMAFLV